MLWISLQQLLSDHNLCVFENSVLWCTVMCVVLPHSRNVVGSETACKIIHNREQILHIFVVTKWNDMSNESIYETRN